MRELSLVLKNKEFTAADSIYRGYQWKEVSKLSSFYAVPGYKLQVYVLVVRFYVWGVPFLRFSSVFLRFFCLVYTLPTITFDPPIGFQPFKFHHDQQIKTQS